MTDLSDLYREVILDHNGSPRNFGTVGKAQPFAGHNPLCGDRVLVTLKMAGDTIQEIKFTGSGCAISQASASVMTEAVKGKTEEEARVLCERFHQMVTTESDEPVFDEMDPLSSFAGVRQYPVRVKCATLAWHTLIAALDNSTEKACSE